MIDATLDTFDRDVIEASRRAPVLVDFWAPWCGPCRALAPVLEKLEREAGGRWHLAKVNSDENPELSARYGVRGIPFVLAFVDGEPVSSFTGAQPEGAVRAFLAQVVPDPSALELRRARAALASGEGAQGESHLRNALALDPSNDAARLDLVTLHLDRGETEAAKAQWVLLSARASEVSGHDVAAARLEVAVRAASLPTSTELATRIATDPADLEARLHLAEVHMASRDYGPALEQFLEIVKRDRGFGDDIGRRRMLAVFELADPDTVAQYRRRLAATLY